MLIRKVDGESPEFAACRKSLCRLCDTASGQARDKGVQMKEDKAKESVSIRLTKSVWHDYKVMCAVLDVRIGEYLEQMIEREIEQHNNKEQNNG